MSFIEPNVNKAVIDGEGKMLKALRLWVQSVTRRQLLRGSGSPEGVVSAVQDAQYVDIDSDDLYYKRDADVNGDTTKGWRVIS